MELVGRRFGHIRVTGVVGAGGMGEVYEGYDETLERKVALKVLHQDMRLDDEARIRLLREARALSKLDHPNICRIHDYIETGHSDLLVLEYIDGRTLDDALREKMPRAEKLRIAASIAGVLVAAHRAGIVHRDLKPDNVMLTRAGEVKVLDFGLARWLHRGRARASAADTTMTRLHAAPSAAVPDGITAEHFAVTPPRVQSANDDSMATAAGITMGTPMYMSPEQARGESLTPASDMFAFGLLLQVLFSGREAHQDSLGARDVILRVAHGQTDPVEGVTRDIRALINRLKSFAPTDRPTAVETIERLQYFADTPRRIARRGVVAALVLIAAVGGWRYTVDLQRERAAAVKAEAAAVTARAEAERRRGQAEDLIDFMMGDLHQKLAPIGRLEVLDAAADRSMKYMTSLRPELMSADELARNATALQHVGEVRIAQGKLPEALRAFEQAEAIAKKAVAKDPRNLPVRFALGQTQFYVGEVHRQLGNKAGAMANMRDYLATSEMLARSAPENLDYQIELAYGYSNIGSLLQSEGDLAGALEHYERSVAVKRARLRTDPANRAWQGDVAQTINKIGSVLLHLRRLSEARQQFAEEQAIYVSALAAEPNHALWKSRLITSHAYLGKLLIALGDLSAADDQFAAATTLAGELSAFDPENVTWRRDLAAVLGNASVVDRMQGRAATARARAARAETLMREAAQADPRNKAWARDLVFTQLRHACALYADGAADAAKARAEAVASAGDRGTTEMTAEALILLGRIAADRGDAAAAHAAWRKAAELLADVPVASGAIVLLDLRARALLLLGRAGEARPMLTELRRCGYVHPDLMRLPRVASGVFRENQQTKGEKHADHHRWIEQQQPDHLQPQRRFRHAHAGLGRGHHLDAADAGSGIDRRGEHRGWLDRRQA